MKVRAGLVCKPAPRAVATTYNGKDQYSCMILLHTPSMSKSSGAG